MQSTEHIPAARTPSYHSLTGLSYTELWSSVHATYHHPAPTPNYHTGSFPGEQQQHQQLHELSPATGASVAASDACADMELSGSGSQWSGDSSVNGGNITLSKLEVARGVTSPERGQSTVMINATGTRDVTKLRPFPPSVSQNRLSMQAPPTTDRDQYSFDPRWIDSKILQGGERFKIADNDAADTLLSMKRAAVVHLNTAMSKSGGLKGLNLVDYGEGKTDAPQCVKMESPSRHDGDVLTLARHTDNKDSLHSWYWRNQEISHILSSAEADDSPPSTREPAPEPDSRSGRHHAVEGYQTGMYGNSKAINSNYWAGSPAVNRRDFSSSSWYYTRPVGDNLSNDFTSARWNVNAPPPVPKPQNLGRAKIMPTERGCGTLITHAVQQQKLKNSDIRNNQDGNQSPHSHKCHICGKSCTRPSSLRTHLRCHYGEKPFLCQLCGKSFSQAANLTAHMRIHSGEKPFKCRVCNRSFSQSSSVKTHMRTHTGERPYPCTYCSKSFSDSSTLSNHRRTHTGEKPYQCRVCCRSFSQSGNLNRHLRIHRRPGGGQNTPTNGLTALRE